MREDLNVSDTGPDYPIALVSSAFPKQISCSDLVPTYTYHQKYPSTTWQSTIPWTVLLDNLVFGGGGEAGQKKKGKQSFLLMEWCCVLCFRLAFFWSLSCLSCDVCLVWPILYLEMHRYWNLLYMRVTPNASTFQTAQIKFSLFCFIFIFVFNRKCDDVLLTNLTWL